MRTCVTARVLPPYPRYTPPLHTPQSHARGRRPPVTARRRRSRAGLGAHSERLVSEVGRADPALSVAIVQHHAVAKVQKSRHILGLSDALVPCSVAGFGSDRGFHDSAQQTRPHPDRQHACISTCMRAACGGPAAELATALHMRPRLTYVTAIHRCLASASPTHHAPVPVPVLAPAPQLSTPRGRPTSFTSRWPSVWCAC